MKYEKERLDFLANEGYLKRETCISEKDYKQLSATEKEEYVEIKELIAGGIDKKYAKYTDTFNEKQFSNIMLLKMHDKISKCEKNIKIITVIMIVFAIITIISLLISITAINNISDAINSLMGRLDLY